MNINVNPVNDPPVIFPYFNRSENMNEGSSIILGFHATDVDNTLVQLSGQVITFPLRGSLYDCVPTQNGGCTNGEPIQLQSGSNQFVLNPLSPAEWAVVFVPNPNDDGRNYATIGFSASDPDNARSQAALTTIRVLAVNNPPVVSVGGPFDNVLLGESVPLINTTVYDSDAFSKPLLLIISVVSGEGIIGLNSDEAFQTRKSGTSTIPAPCNIDSTGILTCTASQQALNDYLQTLFYNGSAVGVHILNVFVNDLGHGAEPGTEAENERTDAANITVTYEDSDDSKTDQNNNLTYAVIGASLAGVGLIFGGGVFLKKIMQPNTESGYFEKMAFDDVDATVVASPYYLEPVGTGTNILYEDPNH